jgi:hypothetical protein
VIQGAIRSVVAHVFPGAAKLAPRDGAAHCFQGALGLGVSWPVHKLACPWTHIVCRRCLTVVEPPSLTIGLIVKLSAYTVLVSHRQIFNETMQNGLRIQLSRTRTRKREGNRCHATEPGKRSCSRVTHSTHGTRQRFRLRSVYRPRENVW